MRRAESRERLAVPSAPTVPQAQLVRLINAAYAVGEAGLWLGGTTRTGPGEVAEMVRSGGMLTATLEGKLVGYAYVRRLDAGTADLGFISTAPTAGAAASAASWCARRRS